jgi:soluble lytic murein transglycosylase-like protein
MSGSQIGAMLGNSQLFLTNPELAIAQRRAQMAQQLLQAGTDSSPIRSPWQGLNRLAQALLGGYEARKAEDVAKDYTSRRDAALSSAMGPAGMAAPAGPSAPAAPQEVAPAPAAAPVAPVSQVPLPPAQYMPLIQAASQRTGIPVPVLVAQIQQESGFNPNAVGSAGEIGLGQIKPTTAVHPGYGVQGVAPSTLTDPAANINFTADYLAGRAKAAGLTDWNNPQQRDAALTAYNGGGDPQYAQHVARYLPQQPGAAPAGTPGVPPPQAGGAPAGNPPVGMASPQVQQSLALLNQAQRLLRQFPGDPVVAQQAQALQQRAQLLMSLDTYKTRPDGTQVNTRTGQVSYPPTPRTFSTQTGDTGIVLPGGQTRIVASGGANPGVNADANAQRVLLSYPPNSPEYRQAYNHLYPSQTTMTANGPVTFQPKPPPAGLPAPVGAGAPPAGQQGAPQPGVNYAIPVQPHAADAVRLGVPLSDGPSPYAGMPAAEQQKAKTEAIKATRERFAKTDVQDAADKSMITDLERFIELNKAAGTGPQYGLPLIGGLLSGATSLTSPAFQELRSISNKIAPMLRQAGSGNMSDKDVEILKSGSVGVDKSPQVNSNIAHALIIARQNGQDRQQFIENYVELNGTEAGADRLWSRYMAANPVFDPAQKETYGLNTHRQPWQQWFHAAIDPQTGKLRPETAPKAGGMRWNPQTGRVEGG